MTEAQWLRLKRSYLDACTWLLEEKKNHRKFRLWSCACCRRLGDLLTDERSWSAIEVAERKADGLADKGEIQMARKAAARVPRIRQRLHGTPAEWAASATHFLLQPQADYWLTAVIRASIATAESGARTRTIEDQLQFELLRDIFGNPFCPLAINPAWLAWNDSTVQKLAQAIYDERAFDRMPILADALEEAGCTDTDMLHHCRPPGEHVRGCWVVDLILGKG